MKEICNHFLVIIIVLLLFVVLFILVRANPCIVAFTATHLTTLLGIIISCVSIVITAYFVLLAIDAYSKIREIRMQAEDVKKSHDLAKLSLRGVGNATVISYDCVILYTEYALRSLNRRYLDEEDKKSLELLKKWRLDCQRDRLRLGLFPLLLDEEKRIVFIRDLSTKGEWEDIKKLERICKSEEESEEIKKISEIVLNELKKKYDNA